MGETNEWFDDMLEEGFVSTSSTWMERAIEQRHPRLSLALVYSLPLVYSQLDIVLLEQERLN